MAASRIDMTEKAEHDNHDNNLVLAFWKFRSQMSSFLLLLFHFNHLEEWAVVKKNFKTQSGWFVNNTFFWPFNVVDIKRPFCWSVVIFTFYFSFPYWYLLHRFQLQMRNSAVNGTQSVYTWLPHCSQVLLPLFSIFPFLSLFLPTLLLCSWHCLNNLK